MPAATGKFILKPLLKPPTSHPDGQDAPRYGGNPNAWTGGAVNRLKSDWANARNPSHVSRQKSVTIIEPTPSHVAGRMDDMHFRRRDSQDWRRTGRYDPSVGPSPSAMTTKWRQTNAPSRATHRTAREPFQNDVCKISNYTRRDFRLGDVISAPFHVANTNPNVDPRDDRLTITREGPAYSKRRMMVVLFAHQYDLFCLPIYSFSGRGLREKPEPMKVEYVCVKNVGAEDFVNEGIHPPVEIMARHPVTDSTTVQLSGGLRVGCREDIAMVGRLTETSYVRLVRIWKELTTQAQNEGY